MKLADLPDIDFVDLDVDNIEAVIFAAYYRLTGRSELAKGDPVRLFILFVVNVVVMLLNKLNETGKQNLLKYSTGEKLDNLAALWGVTRIPAKAARTTLAITLSAAREQETIIPAGTRVSPGGKVYFAVDGDVVIPPGETEATVTATCLTVGTVGNGYAIGSNHRSLNVSTASPATSLVRLTAGTMPNEPKSATGLSTI